MRILNSARKHGIADEDIRHALAVPIRYVEQEYDGETRILVIGADRSSRHLELVVIVDDDDSRVIHANVLQRKRYHYL